MEVKAPLAAGRRVRNVFSRCSRCGNWRAGTQTPPREKDAQSAHPNLDSKEVGMGRLHRTSAGL